MYRIEYKKSSLKDSKRIPASVLGRIKQKIEGLAFDPFPSGFKKLKGNKNRYRIRVGDYRVIYSIENDILVMYVITIRHRKEVYEVLA